jgi:predicted Zn-dependent peptidase
MAELGKIDPDRLLRAIRATFASCNTHPIPKEIPDPPAQWSSPYQKLAAQVSLGYLTLDEANQAIKAFLNPLLRGEKIHLWDPDRWVWS